MALARALMRHPPVLLLDEPLGHLDAAQRKRVRRELKVLQREFGYTTIVVTHDQLEALSLADRMAVMNAGIIQQFGTPDEIFDDPANQFVADFVGEPSINLADGVVETAGDGLRVRIGEAGALPGGHRDPPTAPRSWWASARRTPCHRTSPTPGGAGAAEVPRGRGRGVREPARVRARDGDRARTRRPPRRADPPDRPLSRGDRLRLTAAARARVYLFDPGSGERLR